MADNLTDVAENGLLDYLFGGTFAITTPIKIALSTSAGSDTAAGTEVSGGSYARQTITVGAASAGSVSNSATITFTNMPAATVTGLEIYDSNGTPKRLAYGTLTTSKTVAAGDNLQFNAGSIVLSLA